MLKANVTSLTQQIEQIKKEIIKEINDFEQNSKIKTLSHNCFTIKRSDLSKDLNLSPFYYNHKTQYQYISNVINKSKIEDILSVLTNIIETGRHEKANYHKVKFAPEVINKIKTLI